MAVFEIVTLVMGHTLCIYSICNLYNQAELSKQTLNDLLDTNLALQRRLTLVTNSLWVEQFSEVFVCVLVFFHAVLELLPRVYVYMSSDDYENRHVILLETLGILFGIYFCTEYCSWKLVHNSMPFMQTFTCLGSTKTILVYCLRSMVQHGVAFLSKCQSCQYPYACLFITQCLRDGTFMINGEDARYTYPRNTTNMDQKLLEMWRQFDESNLSFSDLGCDGKDVECTLGVNNDITLVLNNFSDL